MDQLVASLVVILFPGIIAAVIADKITVHSRWGSFKFSLYAFVLGIASYAVLQMLNGIIQTCSIDPQNWNPLNVWSALATENPSIPTIEVLCASFVAIPIAFLVSVIINRKWLNKIARKLGVSVKFGDENLFSFYLNSKEINWVYVRDISNNLTYKGLVASFAETDQIQELVLLDVTVYRYEDSEELYDIPSIYLSKPIGSFIIEDIPKQPPE